MGKRAFQPTKHRDDTKHSADRTHRGPHISISCRNVGCGGTTVEMYPTPEGVRCVWSNETSDDSEDYVCVIPWSEWRTVNDHPSSQKHGRA